MKNILTRHIILCTFCLFTINVAAMDRTFRGSEEEIEAKMYSVFPVGTHKAKAISVIKSKFKVDNSDIDFYSYGDHPFTFNRDGKKLFAYSGVAFIAARYRYIIFVKVVVEVAFLFDQDDKLNRIHAVVDMDSL